MRMTCPGSGTGTITADGGWRITSTVTSRPFGIVTRSRSTSKTLPSKMRSVERRSVSGMAILGFFLLRDLFDDCLQVGRQRRIEFHAASVAGMGEAQARGVEE